MVISEFRESQSSEAFLKQSEIETDPLLKQIQIRAPEVGNKSLSSSGFQHSQTSENREASLVSYATCLPFVQKNEVGGKRLSQKDGATFASSKTLASFFQGLIDGRRPLGHLDPGCSSHFSAARKITPNDCHFVVHFDGNDDLFEKRAKKIEPANPGKTD
jgi:hypothetical protein